MSRNPYMELYSFIGVGLGRELSVFEIFDLARFWPYDPCERGEPNPACKNVGHSARITSLAFSPDGKAVASGSIDATCKVCSPPPPRFQAEWHHSLRNGETEPSVQGLLTNKDTHRPRVLR